MVRVQLDETISGSESVNGILVFVIRVADLELRLLRELAVGIARLELFVVTDSLLVVAADEIVHGLAVQLLSRPVARLVVLVVAAAPLQQGTADQQRASQKRYTRSHGNSRPKSVGL